MRHHFDEVQIFALSKPERVIKRNHAKLLFVVIDDTDFARADLSVTAVQRFTRTNGSSGKREAQ